MAFTAIERLRCRYDCAQHPPAPLPGRSRRSLADRLRVQLGATTIKYPTHTPEKATPAAPPADAPPQIRAALADWFYTVCYYKNAWDARARKAWAAIRVLPIKLQGPKGWGEPEIDGLVQPGWIDLAERAEIAIRQAGISEDIVTGWSTLIDRWIAEWNKDYTENVSRRMVIYSAWQAQYVEEKIEEYQEAVDQFIDEHGVSIGAGVVVGGAALVAVGLALAFPDEARKAAQAGYKGAKRLVKK